MALPARGRGFESQAAPPWVVVAVLGLHLLLLWGWREATRQLTAAAPRPTSAMSLKEVTAATIVPAPRGQASTARSRTAAAHPRPRDAPARPTSPPPRIEDSPPEAANSSPPPGFATPAELPDADRPVAAVPAASSPLLDSAATRRAIRELARLRPITEQAALASGLPTPAPGARLGESIREAGRGDCAKGEFAGAGMGLLSLPFLVAAMVGDTCAQ